MSKVQNPGEKEMKIFNTKTALRELSDEQLLTQWQAYGAALAAYDSERKRIESVMKERNIPIPTSTTPSTSNQSQATEGIASSQGQDQTTENAASPRFSLDPKGLEGREMMCLVYGQSIYGCYILDNQRNSRPAVLALGLTKGEAFSRAEIICQALNQEQG
jgi:hypothetical protein